MKNHALSATMHPANPASKANAKLRSCSAESAPAAISTGAAGSGMPSCSKSTHENSSMYPYVSNMWVGNSIEMNPVLIRVGNSVRLVPAYRAEIKGAYTIG
jgi:hypothetical protein